MSLNAVSSEVGNQESFQDSLNHLYEELALAVRWQRPSILFVVYESEIVRRKAEEALRARLSILEQEIYLYQVDNDNFDIPLALSKYDNRENTVFFVSNLKWGGGKTGHNAYRALNLRRELFVENQIRVVFWLTKTEAANLAKQAPDFWAFRHRVFELAGYPVKVSVGGVRESLVWDGELPAGTDEEIDSKINYREKLLLELPKENESLMARTALVGELAYLYWLSGEKEKGLHYLEQGAELASRAGLSESARFAVDKGVIYFDLGQIDEAISSLKQAIKLQPDAPIACANLAAIYHSLGDTDNAIHYAKKAVEIAPREADFWIIFGSICLELETLEAAKDAFLKAVKYDPENVKAWILLGKSYLVLKHTRRAIRSFRKAIKLDHTNVESWESLGSIYQNAGRSTEAKKSYQSLLEIEPNNSRALSFFEHESAGKT